MNIMNNLFGQQDNTKVMRNQPSQLFWNNGKIDKIITPIAEDRLYPDNRNLPTRLVDMFANARIGDLYSKAESTPLGMVIPSTQGVRNLVGNDVGLFDRATGALEVLPLVGAAGYKGIKALNKVSSNVANQANDIMKLLPSRQVMDYNNNLEALKELQKFSDEKGYGLKNVIRYAKDQNKTDAVIKSIMDRNRTFARGVSAPDRETAIKYLTEVPGETGAGRYGLNKGEHALYTSNSLGSAEGYTYGNGYIGRIKLPTDFTGESRIKWIERNKGLPDNIIKQPYQGTISTLSDKNQSILSDKMYKIGMNIGRRKDSAFWQYIGDKTGIDKYDDKLNFLDLDELVSQKTIDEAEAYALKDNLVAKLQSSRDKIKDFSNKFNEESLLNHYLFQGTPGQKIGDVVDIKQITPDIWKQKSRAHEGMHSPGLSLAGMLGLSTADQDSISNLFGGNR